MNNGILSSFENTTIVSSNYLYRRPNNGSASIENFKIDNIVIKSNNPTTYSLFGGTYNYLYKFTNPQNMISNIFHFNTNYDWQLDFNNLIYVVDTTIRPLVIGSAYIAGTYTGIIDPTIELMFESLSLLEINWGDGVIESISPSDWTAKTKLNSNSVVIAHTYKSHGIYFIQVKHRTGGSFDAPLAGGANSVMSNSRDGKCIGILSFGRSGLLSSNSIARLTTGFVNLQILPKSLPASISSLAQATSNVYLNGSSGPNIALWDVSNITSSLGPITPYANEDISNWVFGSGLTSLANCFSFSPFFSYFNNGDLIPIYNNPNIQTSGAGSLPNGYNTVPGDKLNKWNVSNITNMSNMFFDARFFNQNLSGWDVRKVNNFSSMFAAQTDAMNFFDGDLSNWQLIANNTNCNNMFGAGANLRARAFTGKGLNTWNTSGVINTSSMFIGNGLFNQNLSGWNTSKITDAGSMFRNCSSFIASGLENWDTSNVTNMSFMFANCTQFNINLSNWNTSKVSNTNTMFGNCTNFRGSGLENWNTSGFIVMSDMFSSCTNFNANLSGWNISNVTTMPTMFLACTQFRGSGLEKWNTSKINSSLQNMFNSCSNFNANLSGWNVSKVTNMISMFINCSAFRGSGLENWNLAGLTVASALTNFLAGTTLASGQYDLILNSWNTNKSSGVNGVANWRTDLAANFGTNKYTSAGSGARAALVTYGWTITDGGFQP